MTLMERRAQQTPMTGILRGLRRGTAMAVAPDIDRLHELGAQARQATEIQCEWVEVGMLLRETMDSSTNLDPLMELVVQDPRSLSLSLHGAHLSPRRAS